jgi:integral membrane protein
VNPLRSLRRMSALEGASLLALLGVAMPLKYALGLPVATRLAGTLHGLLFLVLLAAVARAHFERAAPPKTLLRVAGLSLVPFGFLAAERLLRRDEGRDEGRDVEIDPRRLPDDLHHVGAVPRGDLVGRLVLRREAGRLDRLVDLQRRHVDDGRAADNVNENLNLAGAIVDVDLEAVGLVVFYRLRHPPAHVHESPLDRLVPSAAASRAASPTASQTSTFRVGLVFG